MFSTSSRLSRVAKISISIAIPVGYHKPVNPCLTHPLEEAYTSFKLRMSESQFCCSPAVLLL